MNNIPVELVQVGVEDTIDVLFSNMQQILEAKRMTDQMDTALQKKETLVDV